MALKTFDIDGFSDTVINVQAIAYAAQMGADIINASWGGGPRSQAMLDAITTATAGGALFVAASGNAGIDIDEESIYPCDFPIRSLICVGASGRDNKRLGFSNYGKLSVDIAAPGEQIYSTFVYPAYDSIDGTSMAAPFVSGAAALIKSFDPSLSPIHIKKAILESGTDLDANKNDFVTGKRLNIAAAIEYVGGKTTTPPVEPPPVKPPPTVNLPTINLTIAIPAGDEALMLEFMVNKNSEAIGYIAALYPEPLVSEQIWDNATQSKIPQSIPTSRIRHFITGLIPNQKGYVSVRAVAKDGTLGPIGPSVYFNFNGRF